MPTTRDYYEILGVERTSDGEEIKRAYRRLAMKHHPDRTNGDADSEGRFKEASEAYEVLSDESKRRVYDQYGHEGLRGQGGAAAHDFSRMRAEDIFSMFEEVFGGGFGGRPRAGRRRGPARGYDLETEIELTLDDVLHGAETDVEIRRLEVCKTCSGSGAAPGSEPVKCATCGGVGQVTQQGLGGMFRIQTTCPHCRGAGTRVEDPCAECRGKGRTPVKRRLSVKTPPGIHDGQVVRVRGEGEPPAPNLSPDGSGLRGDLHVVVRVEEHELFERDGDNLRLSMPISFTQAALGADLTTPTLEAPTPVQVARGAQHGDVIRVPGQGLPNLRSGRRGDLLVHLRIEIPRKLTDKQRELLREYAETEDLSVLPEQKGFFDKIKEALGG